jgi:hypothetical protein
VTTAVIALAVVCVLELAVIAWLMWLRRDEGKDIIALADGLARRIQAPQLAAVETANAEEGPLYAPPALIPDDDDAYWESREALAERAMREEVGGSNG